MFFLRKKKDPTEKMLENMLKYSQGNTSALNKYEFQNLIGTLNKMNSRLANDYYKNTNGKWVAYHNRGGSMKNMLLEDIGLYGPNAFKGYLNNYKGKR